MYTAPASTFITATMASSALSAISLRSKVRLTASETKLIAVRRGSRKGFGPGASGSFMASRPQEYLYQKSSDFSRTSLDNIPIHYEQTRQACGDLSPRGTTQQTHRCQYR